MPLSTLSSSEATSGASQSAHVPPDPEELTAHGSCPSWQPVHLAQEATGAGGGDLDTRSDSPSTCQSDLEHVPSSKMGNSCPEEVFTIIVRFIA